MKASSAHTYEGNSQTLLPVCGCRHGGEKASAASGLCGSHGENSDEQGRVSDLLLEGSLPVICGFRLM